MINNDYVHIIQLHLVTYKLIIVIQNKLNVRKSKKDQDNKFNKSEESNEIDCTCRYVM